MGESFRNESTLLREEVREFSNQCLSQIHLVLFKDMLEALCTAALTHFLRPVIMSVCRWL